MAPKLLSVVQSMDDGLSVATLQSIFREAGSRSEKRVGVYCAYGFELTTRGSEPENAHISQPRSG